MAKMQIILIVILTILVLGAITIYLNLDNIWKMLYPLKYKNLVFKYADFFDLDPYLVTAIMYRESKFDTRALSPKGAIGLMQIMPDTASWIAQNLKIEDFQVDDLYDSETNIYFANWYLADLSHEFEGNLIAILAAYNGGRGNVNKWITENQWSGEVHKINQIPFPETQKFVSSVLSLYQRYLQLYEGE